MTRAAGRPAVVVRRARQADVPAVADIERASFGDPWPAEAFVALLERDVAWLAVAEGVEGDQGVLGYVVLFLVADEAEVANIAVAEPVRGRGVGAALLDTALEVAHERGVRNVYLEVRASNVRAQALYASRGFAEVGRRRRYYRRPEEDAIVLRYTLPEGAGGPSGQARRRGRPGGRRA